MQFKTGKLIVLTGIPLLFLQCTIKDPVIPVSGVAPVIENIMAPESLDLTDLSKARVSASVSDPQGYENITLVLLSVNKGQASLSQDTLRDDGLNGDILVRDGRFSIMLKKEHFQKQTGVFHLKVQAFDADGHESKIQADTISTYLNPPVLGDLEFPDVLTEATLPEAFFAVRVTDGDGLADIDSVWCDLVLPKSTDPFMRFKLVDDGTSGDANPHDSLFSRRIDLSDTIRIPGEYTVHIQASDSKNALSRMMTDSIRVDIPNQSPVLGNLNAPATVFRNNPEPILLTVQADDPQGLNDVWRVCFNVTKPDGAPSAGNPFCMYDDGDSDAHGDDKAGDGVYSLFITISVSNDVGTYRFDFFAEDRNGVRSEALTHFMDVE